MPDPDAQARAPAKARPADRVTQSPLAGLVTRMLGRIDRSLNAQARGLAALALPFYRRYPYSGPMGLFSVDLRGAYSPEDGFFFNRIPKAANSTIMATLAQRSEFRRTGARARSKSRFLRPSRMSSGQVDGLDGCLCFTFVRDPYGRALSAYSDKVLRKRKQARAFYRWLGPERPAEFIEFLRYLADGGVHDDPHWAPQTDLMLLPLADFDLIGRLESLEADLGRIVARLFGPDQPLAIRRAGPRTDSNRRLAAAYTPEGLALVNRIYAADFAAFGYPMREA